MRFSRIHKRNCIFLSLIFLILFLQVFFFLLSRDHAQHTESSLLLRINEICTQNPGTTAGGTVTYEDYIELYNPGEESVSLEHYSLSDDTHDLAMGPLPAATIEPGGFYVIYAVGKNGSVPEGCTSVPFALSDSETISLSYSTDPEGGNLNNIVIDSITVPELSSGAVYARITDGQDILAEMRPSPDASNENAGRILESPVFSMESGFYEEDSLTLELQASEGLSIHYTLDGSVPDQSSPVYTEPLILSDPTSQNNVYAARDDIAPASMFYRAPFSPVDKAMIIRAVTYDEQGNFSNPVTASYFLGYAEKEGYKDAAVLSLVADPADLFDSENGIYVLGQTYEDGLESGAILESSSWSDLLDYTNFYLKGSSSERNAHISFYDSSHSLSFQMDCGIRIRGNESRSYPQKSFSLFARKRFGTDSFPSVLF